MHSVIALEDGGTKDIVRPIKAYQQKQTLRPILSLTDVKHIVLTVYHDPLFLKHEVEVWKIAVAF